jgi:hypothetical protein
MALLAMNLYPLSRLGLWEEPLMTGVIVRWADVDWSKPPDSLGRMQTSQLSTAVSPTRFVLQARASG